MSRADEYGKKIDVLTIRGKVRTHKVDLRFDRPRMMFSVLLKGEWYSDKDARVLEKRIIEAAEKFDEVVFSWVIKYEMRTIIGESTGLGSSCETYLSDDETMSIDDQLARHLARGEHMRGLQFDFNVLEVSAPLDSDPKIRLCKAVKEDAQGVLVAAAGDHERHGYYSDEHTLPFTQERYDKLKAVQQTLEKLYMHLQSLLTADGKRVAALLDAAKGPLLLQAAPAPALKKGKR